MLLSSMSAKLNLLSMVMWCLHNQTSICCLELCIQMLLLLDSTL